MQCLMLGVVEVLWICVRKGNDSRITKNEFARAVTHLKSEVINRQSEFKTISIPDTLVLNSMCLIETHSLNSVDAMVLRSALDIATELRNTGNRLVLVSSELRRLKDCLSLTQKLIRNRLLQIGLHIYEYKDWYWNNKFCAWTRERILQQDANV